MPRIRRRRRGRRLGRRSVVFVVIGTLVMVVVGVLAVGSIVEISAQSVPYRHLNDQGYALVISRVVDASNQTGARLAAVIHGAPMVPNQPMPNTARGVIQQALDLAVSTSTEEARGVGQLSPPSPSDGIAGQLSAVFKERAEATTNLVAVIDQLLGMAPLAIAGAREPTTTTSVNSTARISVGLAAQEMAADGVRFERADRAYASLAALLMRMTGSGAGFVRLPTSVWAPFGAPLSSIQLGNSATPLEAAVPLVAFHQMVITAVGLSPAAVPSTASNDPAISGMIAMSCSARASTTPGQLQTVLPPTSTVTPLVTVTNCGTVTETNVVVTETLDLADSGGVVPPRTAAAGSSFQSTVTTLSGQSQALSLPALTVAKGHNYVLTITVSPATGQVDVAGLSQRFLLQIVA